MFSFKFYVREEKNNLLTLRIINNRCKAEMSMGLLVTPMELDAVINGSSRNVRLSKVLASWTLTIKSLMVELADKSEANKDVKEIREILQLRLLGKSQSKPDETQGNFIPFFKGFMDGKTMKGTYDVYKYTYDKILSFDPDIRNKDLEDVGLKWLTDFEAFCAKTATKNARNIHLRNIRAVFNNAIDYEITSVYPFRRFKIRPEETRKRSLSVDELRKLFNCPVEPYAEIYRDCFKLIFMLCGINTVDLHALKSITKDGRIEYKRAKTGRLYSIKVEPEALEIIEKYQGTNGLLCIADRWSDSRNFRHQLNKALQRIGEVERRGRGGKKVVTSAFPELSSYWARHTWATIAYEIGIPKDVIAQALGHSDGHDVTNIYIREDVRKVDEANRRVLDWVLYGKR